MSASAPIARFGLFGERESVLAPEFIHIETISSRSQLYDWTITPHAHPGIFQILFLTEGTGVLASDRSETELTAGALVILPPGCVHAFRFSSGAEGWVLSTAIELLNDPRLARLCASARQTGASQRNMQLPVGSVAHERLTWLLDDIARALRQDRAGTLPDSMAARVALLISLVTEIFDGEHSWTLPSPRALLVERFRAQVEADFRSGRSVVDYARSLGTTAPTLTRCCRIAHGKAPGEMILDRILLEAMRSLTYSGATVSQIAADLGFSEPAYFARFFKKRAGMTATDFRHKRGWLAANMADRMNISQVPGSADQAHRA